MKGLKYLAGVTALVASLYGCVGANRQVYGLNGQNTTFEGTREPEGNRMVDGLEGLTVGASLRQVYGLNGQSTTFEGTREPEGNRMVDGLKGKKVDMSLEEACNAEIESYTNKTEEFINKPGFQGFPDDY